MKIHGLETNQKRDRMKEHNKHTLGGFRFKFSVFLDAKDLSSDIFMRVFEGTFCKEGIVVPEKYQSDINFHEKKFHLIWL